MMAGMKTATRAIAAALTITLICVAPSASASTGPSAKQKSQIKYLQTYGHEPDGKTPTFSQAFAVVQRYPKVPTMAQAKAARAVDSTSRHIPIVATPKAMTQKMSSRTVTRYWRVPPDVSELGYQQTVTWQYNYWLNHVCCHTHLHGFPWVAVWASWAWSYDGEQDTDGYPYWSFWNGAPTGYYDEMELRFIENFHWGYGPISGGLSLHMWLILYADGTTDIGFGDDGA